MEKCCSECRSSTSCKKIGNEIQVYKSRIQRNLKKHEDKSYEIKVVQSFHLGDPQLR